MNEMKRVLQIDLGLNREDLLKTGDTKKIKRVPFENTGLYNILD